MKTTSYKHFLLIAVNFIAITAMAQSKKDSTVPFKELNKNNTADNFTIREIKKKELEIAPFKIVLLRDSLVVTAQQKPEKNKKKKQK